MNTIIRKHIETVKGMDCSVCGQSGPSDAHHILEGRIPGRKSPDMLVIPLCKNCHQGALDGIHGQRRMWSVMKANELECLANTLETIMRNRG